MENMLKIIVIIALFLLIPRWLWGQKTKVKLALLQSGCEEERDLSLTALTNLSRFCNDKLGTDLAKKPALLEVADRKIFDYPFLYIPGNEKITFTSEEIENLRAYLANGGFLYAESKTYPDSALERELKKIVAAEEWSELSLAHSLFHQKYDFHENMPESNGEGPLRIAGVDTDKGLVLLWISGYEYGKYWETPANSAISPQKIRNALQMGANIISYALG